MRVAVAIATLLLFLLSFSMVASAQEFPVAERPQPTGGSWSNFFSTQATIPLQTFIIYNTDQCRSIYEGECDSTGKLQFNCYADSAGTCRCSRGDVWTTAIGTVYYASQKCGSTGGTGFISCTDTDRGKVTQTKGTAESSRIVSGSSQTIAKITDACKSSTTLTESYCKDDGNVGTQDYICLIGTTCQDGACKTAQISAKCRDSDGGINPQQKGTVYWSGLATNQPFSDTCNSDTQIKEYYCNGDVVESVARNCGSNERCTRDSGQFEASCKSAEGCTDTDDNNIYSQGRVAWNSRSVTDTCNTDTRVTEYSCSGGVRTQTDMPCPSGYKCESGACILGTPPVITPLPGSGGGTGSVGVGLCYDDSFCKEGLVCYGTDTQKTQGTGTCVVPVGPVTEQPTTPASSICCKGTDWRANYGPAGGTFYYYTTSTTCPNNDPKVEASQCQAASEKKEEEKQEDAAKEGEVPSGSIPSFKKSLDRLNQAEASASLCMIDDQCKSDFCDTSPDVEKKVEHTIPEGSLSVDTSLGKVHNLAGPLTLAWTVTTGTQTFKTGDMVLGLCREEPEAFDLKKLFKENQQLITIGAIVLAAIFILPKLFGK